MRHFGKAWPLGANIIDGGVNFSVFSPNAIKVELLLFDSVNDHNPEVITLDSEMNKTYYYWHIWIPNLKENQLYAYRVDGPYRPEEGLLFDAAKVLVDPYAKAIVGKYDRKLAAQYGVDNMHACLKSAIISDDFDWDSDELPSHDLEKSVIYEMHLSGFTKNKNSGLPEKLRGTYAGLIQKIPYLKELGITAVELLPVYAFDEQDAPEGLTNYWGYSPINFFAVHAAYAAEQPPQGLVNEFKTMVKALHDANIEVILDVVYNHTTENNAFTDGPTLCMRGFANESYYILDEKGQFKNYTGTGNTINANHSVVRRMIMHSLRYWVEEMHIDGFRFDLASVLSRDEIGEPLLNPPILWSIDSDPILANTKIIAEPWDATGLKQVRDFAGDRWIIWNDNFRDSIRKFVKGDAGELRNLALRLLGSPHDLKSRHTKFEPNRSLHFVTCHDGFTMKDLVSYNQKHNLDNAENNRDGSSFNYSWNCGVEGPTDKSEIKRLREKQMKNMFSLLLLSHGTPMILMGDEVMRSQNGNNNVYCQDSELAWMDWDLVDTNQNMLRFVSDLIQFTSNHKTFSHTTYFEESPNDTIPFINFHGVNLEEPDWSYHSRSLAYEIMAPLYGEHFYIIMNMYHETLTFALPAGQWQKVFDTQVGFKSDEVEKQLICPERTIVFLTKK